MRARSPCTDAWSPPRDARAGVATATDMTAATTDAVARLRQADRSCDAIWFVMVLPRALLGATRNAVAGVGSARGMPAHGTTILLVIGEAGLTPNCSPRVRTCAVLRTPGSVAFSQAEEQGRPSTRSRSGRGSIMRRRQSRADGHRECHPRRRSPARANGQAGDCPIDGSDIGAGHRARRAIAPLSARPILADSLHRARVRA